MSDDAELRDDEEGATPAFSDPGELLVPEVVLVVPAAPYESIATHEVGSATEPARQPTFDLNPVLEAVASMGGALDRKLDALMSLFDREVRAESTREKVVDRLHAELQEYKQDLLLKVLRPVFVDLIQLHDDIGKMVAAQPDQGPDSDGRDDIRRLLDMMRGYQQGIEDILYRQGVEPYAHDGDTFDPRRQRAVATIATDDPALAKFIAVRHRKGFQTQGGERMIRPEIVSVYALKRG